MTRDQLENVLHRAGLTSSQMRDVMHGAEAYATAQCRAAVAAGWQYRTPQAPLTSHWQPPHGPGGDDGAAACRADPKRTGAADCLTPMRTLVTCDACKQTTAWKEHR